MQIRKNRNEVFKMLKEKNYQSRVIHLAKISFKNWGEIKIFSDKQKLREFIVSRSALQQKSAFKNFLRLGLISWQLKF